MRRVFLFLVISALFVSGSASALTLRDLIELSRAGLGDEVLLALIDVDRPVFSIDADTLKSLKAAGVSERVIVAIVRSGRASVPPGVATVPEPGPQLSVPPEPRVIVIDHHDAQPQVREVAVPFPVYIPVVPVARRVYDRGDQLPADRADRDLTKAPEPKKSEPVYWGWGGKRRPDAWQDQRDKQDK
jgi:hypothetical protein